MTTTTLGLATMLREGSQAEHTEAESSTFMSELLAGRVDATGYAQYLGRLRGIYEALETTAAVLGDDPIAGAVIDPHLYRGAAIDADMSFWSPAPILINSPAMDEYVARILATRDDPKLYVAHHYTRYLGDLSGGQAIGRILTRTFNLAPGEGVQFYYFADIPKPKLYKEAYRERLNALALTEADRQRIVDEVREVFALNGRIFRELEQVLQIDTRKPVQGSPEMG